MSISVPNVSLREGLRENTVIPQGPNVIGSITSELPRRKTLPLFRDYGKTVNDLITKGFPTTYKVELNTAAENGLKFAFTAEKKTEKVADTSSEAIFVSSQIKTENYPRGLNFTGTIDSEKLEGEVAFSNLIVDNTKAVLKGKFLDNDKTEASAELQYATSNITGTLGLFHKDERARLEASANVGFLTDNISVGGLVSYQLPGTSIDGVLDNFQVGANYYARLFDFTTVFKGTRSTKGLRELNYSVGSRVYYNHSASTTFGADVNFGLGKSFRDLDVKLVALHKFDANTSAKLGVEKSGRTRFAISQRFNQNVTLTLGTEVNALRLEEHNVGVLANFTA